MFRYKSHAMQTADTEEVHSAVSGSLWAKCQSDVHTDKLQLSHARTQSVWLPVYMRAG